MLFGRSFHAKMMKTLAIKKYKPYILPPVPNFLLKIIFGEMADILLKGSAVSSNKIQTEGFEFKDGEFEPFVKALFENKSIKIITNKKAVSSNF